MHLILVKKEVVFLFLREEKISFAGDKPFLVFREGPGHFLSSQLNLSNDFFLKFKQYKASYLVKSTLNTSPSTPHWIKMS